MKRMITIAVGCLLMGAAHAQNTATTPQPNTSIRISRPDNSTGVYKTNPMPGQTTPVEQPAGQLKTTNPFGSDTYQPTGTEPTPTQPYSDYHLTRPRTSPATNVTDQPGSSTNPDMDYQKQLMRVDHSQLPTVMMDALQDTKYTGWEESVIYLDPKTNEYSMDITNDEQTRRFRFDQRGYPIEVQDGDDDQ